MDIKQIFKKIGNSKGICLNIKNTDSDVTIFLSKENLEFELFFEDYPNLNCLSWGFTEDDVYDIDIPHRLDLISDEEYLIECFEQAIEILNERVQKEKIFRKHLSILLKNVESDTDLVLLDYLYKQLT